MNNLDQRLETDLATIREAMANGQTEEAKKQIREVSEIALPGCKLSKEIGDLYFELGFPAMAGRYWYLLENKSDAMNDACELFEHSVGDIPSWIIQAIGWPDDLSPYAKAKLEKLRGQARELRQKLPPNMDVPKGLQDRVSLVGHGIMISVVLFVLAMGVLCIVTWFRN